MTNYDADELELDDGSYATPIIAACENFKPITPLQLLRVNSGVSHPFADRLMEYLTGNAITDDDEIQDDVRRAQKAMSYAFTGSGEMKNVEFESYGVWEPKMRPMLYDAMQIDRYNGNDKNHDVLGYVDKDVETYYRAVEWKDNHKNDGANLLTDLDAASLSSSDPYALHDDE